MPAFSLMPSKSFIIAKGSQNLFVTKGIILDQSKWVVSNSKYVYTLDDEHVDVDSTVFVNSFKEYYDVITTAEILLDYPEVSAGKIKIYANKLPSRSINCDYIVCTEVSGVATDKASEVKYTDNSSLGVTNVQTAIDAIAKSIKPEDYVVTLLASAWVDDTNGVFHQRVSINGVTLDSLQDIDVGMVSNTSMERALIIANANIFHIALDGGGLVLYGNGYKPEQDVSISILIK